MDAGLRLGRRLRDSGDVVHVVAMVVRGECDLQRILPDFVRKRRRGNKSDAERKRAEAEDSAVIHVYSSIKTARPTMTNYRGILRRILQ